MEIQYTRYRLTCTHPFGISRSTHDWYDVLYVYVHQDGITGRGEAAPSERYGEFPDQIEARLRSGIELPRIDGPPEDYQAELELLSGGIHSLKAALDTALWDWWAQKQGRPLYELFHSRPDQAPCSSFTIAIGDFDLLAQKVAEAEPYRILKVKLGTNRDKEIITEIRKHTDKTLRVDANEGWDLDRAREMVPWLADRGVELIEQPLPTNRLEDTARLKALSPIPLIADENCLTGADIPSLADSFHGINIKLMKCGGLTEARTMIATARELGLLVMVGCMIESSVGISAMASLAPQIDFADLDGHVLIDNDPYEGMKLVEGKITLSNRPGLGVRLTLEGGGLR
ncbi:MAG: dipeptide epimerase [Candidatus Neomarinimicrobiota bacterium]|nr:MAG: dipeptide epimerase [Candidatus Neomarinimicrobiota bacterium]